MAANCPILAIAAVSDANRRALIEQAADGAGDIVYLTDLDEARQREALRKATAVYAQHTNQLPDDVGDLLGTQCRLLQFHSAGVDYLPLAKLPKDLPIAGNGGAFAEPMAEHGLALTMAAAKRLFIEHDKLKTGEFNQFVRNKMLAGRVAGILGFGGIGVATARLMRSIGMKVHAIKRSGETDEPVDWIGSPDCESRRQIGPQKRSDILIVAE